MTTVELTDKITKFDQIITKDLNSITFKDVISLIFHAVDILANHNYDNNDEWAQLYAEFNNELLIQNKKRWPPIPIVKNDFSGRMDVFCAAEPYVPSTNPLILLLRLLHIEIYKRSYVYDSFGYYKILSHTIPGLIGKPIRNLSIVELFEVLRKYMQYYIKIYHDKSIFEHQLGQAILKQIDLSG
jgi:hypothetical protein